MGSIIPFSIPTLRLYHQQISSNRFREAGELVSWMGALQGQDFSSVKWAIGLRLPGVNETDVERALADRTIVRTWPMRGTIHVVAAPDVRWLLDLCTPRIISGAASRYRELELDDRTFARGEEVFVRELEGGRIRTRSELCTALDDAGIDPSGQRLYHLLQHAAMKGLLCFGPQQNKDQTFVLLDEWIPGARTLDREPAVAELARRYFQSHGPATERDFARWSGLNLTEARAGLKSIAEGLDKVESGEKTYWSLPAPQELDPSETPVFLLPGFDEYILGYADREAVLDSAYAGRIVPGGNGVFQPTLISHGRVVGTWKRSVKKKGVTVNVEPFEPLPDSLFAAIETPIQRYGQYLGLPAEWSV